MTIKNSSIHIVCAGLFCVVLSGGLLAMGGCGGGSSDGTSENDTNEGGEEACSGAEVEIAYQGRTLCAVECENSNDCSDAKECRPVADAGARFCIDVSDEGEENGGEENGENGDNGGADGELQTLCENFCGHYYGECLREICPGSNTEDFEANCLEGDSQNPQVKSCVEEIRSDAEGTLTRSRVEELADAECSDSRIRRNHCGRLGPLVEFQNPSIQCECESPSLGTSCTGGILDDPLEDEREPAVCNGGDLSAFCLAEGPGYDGICSASPCAASTIGGGMQSGIAIRDGGCGTGNICSTGVKETDSERPISLCVESCSADSECSEGTVCREVGTEPSGSGGGAVLSGCVPEGILGG